MKAVIQRVSEASVAIGGSTVGKIKNGLLIFLGVAQGDDQETMEKLMDKIVNLRIFRDEQDKMNNSLQDIGGQILLVSQFTLLADCKKGRRPSFIHASDPKEGQQLYEKAIDYCRYKHNIDTQTGEFGADMQVQLTNDGPVTIVMDTKELF